MKLLRIGSSNNCNIIYHNAFVSGVHAELLLTDDGELFITDKNSLNGTFVGNTRINPNEETKVQRGDLIRFGDVELNWSHVPNQYGPKAGETWWNIGTSQRNEIVVSSQFASRYHAILMKKDKKFFLMDNDSKNGTMVNGSKIAKNKFIPIKKNDNVICGDVDVTDQIREITGGRGSGSGVLKWILIALAAAAVLAGLVFGALKLFSKPYSKRYMPAVVYVDASYHYEIVFENIPVSKEVWESVVGTPYGILRYEDSKRLSATAFFIDRNGVLATNRHVANPGEYMDDQEKTQVRNTVSEFISNQIPFESCANNSEANQLRNTMLGSVIYAQWRHSGNYRLQNLNAMIRSMKQAPFTIKSVLDYVTVGYPSRYYSDHNEYEHCFVLAVSPTDDKDVALLQLNTKKTPETIKDVIDINRFYDGTIQPLKDKLVWIGYPRGNYWGLDESIHSLLPQVRETMVSKQPGRYTFEFQGEGQPGASGSPIFNAKNGRLYGVLVGGYNAAATYGFACRAKYIKELYDENVEVISIHQ